MPDEPADSINAHNDYAAEYDELARDAGHWGGDVLFGMSYEHLKPGQQILDLGIGTGLGSQQFANAGLQVTGIDGSEQMLEECRAKGFAHELGKCDLNELPLPFDDCSFDHAVACGVLHFFSDLAPLTREVARLTGKGGVFAFTVAALTEVEERKAETTQGYLPKNTPWGVVVYRHFDSYIEKLLGNRGFTVLKKQKLLVKGDPDQEDDDLHRAYVAIKRD